MTTGGFDVELDARAAGAPGARAEARWNAVLEHLAVAAPDGGGADRFAAVLRSIGRQPGGPVAAVVAGAAPAELAALGNLSGRGGSVVIARCGSQAIAGRGPVPPSGQAGVGSGRGPVAPPAPGGAGAAVVPVDDPAEFPMSWNQAVLSCGRRDPVRG